MDFYNFIWESYPKGQIYADLGIPSPAKQCRTATDKLWKIKWFVDFLNEKFKELYVPYDNATVDESMIKFKGRLGFRQYLPAKPTKWGVKVWTLAESDTGYLHCFQVYTGREEGRQEKGLPTELSWICAVTCSAVILQCIWITITPAQNFCGIYISEELWPAEPLGLTIKGLPKDLLPARVHLNRHESKVAQNDQLTFCVWQDTKPVCVLSNFHDPQHVGYVTRRTDADRNQVQVPRLLADYQLNMKGVDLCDQMIGYYLLHHRSRKWWRRIFFYLMMVSSHNAYIIAKDTHPDISKDRWPNFQNFIEEIVSHLIGDTRAAREPAKVDCSGHATEHTIVKLFEKKKVCRECSLTKAPGERGGVTLFGCTQCRVPVHLECQSNHIMRMLRQ